MGTQEVAMWITFGGSILGIVGFVIGNTRTEADKRSRLYERIDEVKKSNEQTFVRKDICNVHHQYVNQKLDSIDKKLDMLIDGKKQNG
jgi:hypothetical protein